MPVLSTDAHASPRGGARLQAIPFLLSTLAGISVARVPLPDNLRPGAARARALAAAYRAVSAFEEREAPPLDLSQVLSCALLPPPPPVPPTHPPTVPTMRPPPSPPPTRGARLSSAPYEPDAHRFALQREASRVSGRVCEPRRAR